MVLNRFSGPMQSLTKHTMTEQFSDLGTKICGWLDPVPKLRWMRRTLLGFMCISPDVNDAPEVKEAELWLAPEPPPNDDSMASLSKDLNEYATSQFDTLVEQYNQATDQAQLMVRHNAYLIAITTSFFKATNAKEPIPGTVLFACGCWLFSIVLLALVMRRLWRPSGIEVRGLQELIEGGDTRLHASANRSLNVGIIKMRILISNEGRIYNYALGATVLGLFVLITSFAFS